MESTKQFLIPAGVAALLVGAAFGMGQRAGSQAANSEAVDRLEDKVATLEARVSNHSADIRVMRLRLDNLEGDQNDNDRRSDVQ